MIKEYALKKLVDAAIKLGTDHARDLSGKVKTSTADLESSINDHVSAVEKWAAQISFADLVGSKFTSTDYIPLGISVMPRRHQLENEPISREVTLTEVLSGQLGQHVVLLGQPGAGKTTSMKYLCHRVIHDEVFFPDRFAFPILVRLKELQQPNDVDSAAGVVLSHIQAVLGIHVTFPGHHQGAEEQERRSIVLTRSITSILNSIRPLIILDGLDEIPTRKLRDQVIEDFRSLAPKLDKSTIILTSRTGEYSFHIDHAAEYEILPLSETQIHSFASVWLGSRRGEDLVEALQHSPFADTAIRPLTIAHLCAIYERIGRIPEKPKTVYRKIVNLLLEEWDEQRSVRRPTEYSNFDVARKADFLASLAYALSSNGSRTVFSKQDLVRAYKAMCEDFGLPLEEATKVASELESHTGLLIQSGYESYEFSHKSIQEYLTAEYIVRLPSIPSRLAQLRFYPNELAIAVAISSSPSDYFSELVGKRFRTLKPDFQFFRTFVNRLLLEKPDFNSTAEVGWSLLDLYSLYLSRVLNADQIPLFIMDQLSNEFSELGQLVRERVSSSQLYAHYEPIVTSQALEGFSIVRMKRRPRSGTPKLDRGAALGGLPAELYVRDSLLRE